MFDEFLPVQIHLNDISCLKALNDASNFLIKTVKALIVLVPSANYDRPYATMKPFLQELVLK